VNLRWFGQPRRQTAEVLTGMEGEFTENSPALAVVYGDVNSTIGAALAAAKLGVRWPTWRRGCAASTTRCRRRSTGG